MNQIARLFLLAFQAVATLAVVSARASAWTVSWMRADGLFLAWFSRRLTLDEIHVLADYYVGLGRR